MGEPAMTLLRISVCALLTLAAFPAIAQTLAYGPELQGFDYPYPVERFAFSSQGQTLDMAYMDVKPKNPNGETAVLLHGKNFCAATWEATIAALVDAGYRVLAPDQIGFCKSSKPKVYQYTFQQLAANTRALVRSLGVERVILIGHSTGGMLALRWALTFPEDVSQLALVDPIGLEDWKAEGVPWQSVDAWRAQELKTTAESLRDYEQATYYAGAWSSADQRWVDMLAGLFNGPGKDVVAENAARIDDMIFTQPVVYEFGAVRQPVLLMIGDKDNTAVGKALAPLEARARLGDYPVLGKAAAAAIPNARLVEFPNYGHAPQIQAPEEFNQALIAGLKAQRPK
jgi:pimeloyl-ACP methyl ester carboxylesterase